MTTTTITPKQSSSIISVSFDSVNARVIFRFVSNPDKDYIYNIDDGEFDFVVNMFSNADSYGKAYHELVAKDIIAPIKPNN